MGDRKAIEPIPIPETQTDAEATVSSPIQETNREVRRNLSDLPQAVPHFVNREKECKQIMMYLHPAHECRYVFLHGAPGMGKTALAIKTANKILENDDHTMVVYVNCKYIESLDDFAGKVVQQIYHGNYAQNDPIPAMKNCLKRNDFLTVLLLDNFEFLSHFNDSDDGKKVEEFIAEVVTGSKNVKLLVTSLEDVGVFPEIGIHKIPLAPFKSKESVQLLKKVCGGNFVEDVFVEQLTEICSGIPLVLYTLMASDDDLVSRVKLMRSTPRKERFEYLRKIKTVPEERKIDVCLDVCFDRLTAQGKETLLRLALLRGWFTPSGAAKVFHSTTLSEHVLALANRSLLEKNKTSGGSCRYSFLSVIREYCKRKASDEQFRAVFRDARNQFIDYFLNFLKDTFKKFLSTNASTAIEEFKKEEENVMQLRGWIAKGEMDDERVKRCIDVFNKVGELLAKMMGRTKFKSLYESLRKKCQDMGDEWKLSGCLTSLGIKEVFNCCCSPGLCDVASARAKEYLEQADEIQTALGIAKGNSRAQCLAKHGRCLAKDDKTLGLGKSKIEEAIRIHEKASEAPFPGSEDVCKVMLGATLNDMAVALSLEGNHRKAVHIREKQVLPIYRKRLGDHPFTATILSNLSNNFHALKEFDNAQRNAEEAFKIRQGLLNDHMDTAKSLFDLGMVHKEKNELKKAKKYLKQCKEMQETVQDDRVKDLKRTKQELEDVCKRLGGVQLE